MKLTLRLFLLFFSVISTTCAQVHDSLEIRGNEIIRQRFEEYEDADNSLADLNALTEILEYRLENPLNINEASREQLQELGFLTNSQIRNLLAYRDKYGIFYTIYELDVIDGLGRSSIEKIMPFVTVAPPGQPGPRLGHITKGRHEIFLRMKRKLAHRSGFQIPDDSLQLAQPGSFYLGDPNSYYLRYSYKGSKHLSLGMTAEKDQGEIFFRPKAGISPAISKLIPPQYGFDFYSGFAELKNMWIIRSLIVGDYHVRFGQGLTLWSGSVFSGGTDPAAFNKYAAAIKPNTSAYESRFMRGVAIRINIRSFDLSIFYSRKGVDANTLFVDSIQKQYVTSLPDDGYHRSINELKKKNVLIGQHLGGHLSISGSRLRIGLTAYHTDFNLEFRPDDKPASLHHFRGKENTNAGVNFELLSNRIIFYGEIAASINGGWAILSGITHTSNRGSVVAVQYREYRKEYQNLLSAAYGARSENANERGIRLSIKTLLSPKFGLQVYAEHISYPWLTYSMVNPYRAIKNELIVDYKAGRNTLLYLKYKFIYSTRKSSDNKDWSDHLYMEGSNKVSLRIRHMLNDYFSVKGQVEYIHIKHDLSSSAMLGSMVAVDLHFHPQRIPFKLSLRYALHNTNNYAARLYAYEQDVLYASSFPAYYGEGFRTYILLKYSPAPWLDTWLRMALSGFHDRNIISSGPEEINGSMVPELKIQLRIKIQNKFKKSHRVTENTGVHSTDDNSKNQTNER